MTGRGSAGSPEATWQLIRVYDADELAVILRCRPSWLKEKARRREIPFTLIGGSYRWTAEHLAEIVRLGERPSDAAVPSPRQNAIPTAGDGQPLLRAHPPRRTQGRARRSAAERGRPIFPDKQGVHGSQPAGTTRTAKRPPV